MPECSYKFKLLKKAKVLHNQGRSVWSLIRRTRDITRVVKVRRYDCIQETSLISKCPEEGTSIVKLGTKEKKRYLSVPGCAFFLSGSSARHYYLLRFTTF